MPHVSSNGKYDLKMISTIVTDNCDFFLRSYHKRDELNEMVTNDRTVLIDN